MQYEFVKSVPLLFFVQWLSSENFFSLQSFSFSLAKIHSLTRRSFSHENNFNPNISVLISFNLTLLYQHPQISEIARKIFTFRYQCVFSSTNSLTHTHTKWVDFQFMVVRGWEENMESIFSISGFENCYYWRKIKWRERELTSVVAQENFICCYDKRIAAVEGEWKYLYWIIDSYPEMFVLKMEIQWLKNKYAWTLSLHMNKNDSTCDDAKKTEVIDLQVQNYDDNYIEFFWKASCNGYHEDTKEV